MHVIHTQTHTYTHTHTHTHYCIHIYYSICLYTIDYTPFVYVIPNNIIIQILTHIHIYTYIYIYIVIFIWCTPWSPFIPSRNLDEVFTYNHIWLISLRSRSHVKASMVLTRADHLFIHNYIRSLLNNILRPIL